MAAGTIRLPTEGSGPYAQTFNNNISGTQQHAQAACLVDATGVTLDASSGTLGLPVMGTRASAATDAGNPVKTGGKYNATLPTLTDGQRGDTQVDSRGRTITLATPVDGGRMSYAGCATWTLAATPTDAFEMNGSATKTVKVQKIRLVITHASLATVNVAVVRRSTQDTAVGTTNVTKVPVDSANDASTVGTMRVHTSNPSALGTEVGNVGLAVTNAFTSAITVTPVEFDFTTGARQELTLRGTSQWLYVNLGSAAAATTAFIEVFWTEE